MKILHVASFLGNIGDNASHMGLCRILDIILTDYEIVRMEIRKFYKNYKQNDKCVFDENFVAYANTFDCLIIGGGGFLDYWVKDSITGTTLDMNPKVLTSLNIPMLITSVGCNPHRDVPSGNIDKFRYFLDELLSYSNIRLAVRNDGSVNSIKKEIGVCYLSKIEEVLDNGYFYLPSGSHLLNTKTKYAAVNITSDQIQMNSSLLQGFDPQLYYKELSKTLSYIIDEKKFDIVFVPHIYSDLKAIASLLEHMNDYVIRKNISVAPCIQYDQGADNLFSIYRESSLVLGMRFHANVCNLAMGKAIVGLSALDRVKYTYDYMGFAESYNNITGKFSEDVIVKIDRSLNQSEDEIKADQQKIAELQENSLGTYRHMFKELNLL